MAERVAERWFESGRPQARRTELSLATVPNVRSGWATAGHQACPVIVNDAFAIKMLNVGVEAPERTPPSKAEVLNGVSGDLAPSRTWSFLLLVLREPHKVPSCEIISSYHSSTKNASSLF